MDVIEAPHPEQVEQAREDYRRALNVLMADRHATETREKQAAVGQCYAFTESLDGATWPIYIAATGLDEDGRLTGWHFQHVPTGQIEIKPETDLQAGFLAERCVRIERSVFVAAFNELLTSIARYANKMPEAR